jgi:hypothetical protein
MHVEAIDYYHSLLKNSLASDAIEKLRQGTERYRLSFDGRPICTVLRPMFAPESLYNYIRQDSLHILTAIQKLGAVILSDEKLRAEMDLTQEEEEIISIEPGFRSPDASGRLDGFLDSRGDFSFVEYNADSPGGLLYGDALGEIFLEMEVVREFAKRYPVRRVGVRQSILDSLLDCYRQWGGRDRPRIAIVDWNEAQTRAEFEICRDHFESQGYATVIVDPRELDYRGGWLRAGSFEINLVYKRVVVGELLARTGLDHPLIRATRERAVCTANSFRVQLMTKKAIFALLDDPIHEGMFSKDEIAALYRHIPWTRKLKEGHTTYHGRRIDLLDFAVSNRNRLVLKPNGEYGGRGVVLGLESSQSEWEQAVRNSLGDSFVLQERVEIQQQIFPQLIEDEIVYENRYLDFDPYTWSGDDVDGAGVRLSPSTLLNVTAGGGSATPMFVLESL